jgi:hypothetical protein
LVELVVHCLPLNGQIGMQAVKVYVPVVVKVVTEVIHQSLLSVIDVPLQNVLTIQEVNMRRRQVEDMPDGRDKSTLLDLLDQQERQIRDMDSADADRASRLSAQATRDRTVNTKENVTLPKMPFAKGGMAKKYNKGGYANCGASMKPDGKRRK